MLVFSIFAGSIFSAIAIFLKYKKRYIWEKEHYYDVNDALRNISIEHISLGNNSYDCGMYCLRHKIKQYKYKIVNIRYLSKFNSEEAYRVSQKILSLYAEICAMPTTYKRKTYVSFASDTINVISTPCYSGMTLIYDNKIVRKITSKEDISNFKREIINLRYENKRD